MNVAAVLRGFCLLLIAAGSGHALKEALYLHDSVVAIWVLLILGLAWALKLTRADSPSPPRRWWALAPLPAFIWLMYAYLKDFFGAASVGAFLFHLQMGAEGEVDPAYLVVGLGYISGYLLVSVAFLILINSSLRLRRADAWIAALLLLSNPFFWANTVWPALQRAEAGETTPDINLVDYYVEPAIGAAVQARNLVLIYAESIERTFADPIFGTAYAPMARLAENALDFTAIHEVENTGWTMAGIVASQCGVPLMPLGILEGSKFDQVERFLPGAQCLGDLLSARGYTGSYLGGADLDFAGKRLFLQQHGYTRLSGEQELKAQVDEAYLNRWGLYDDSLFDIAVEEIRALQASGQPFLFSALTLSAHFPNGYPAQRCIDAQGAFDGEDILYSVECTGRLIHDFIETLRRQRLLDNTVVVVMSDHLSMKNSEWPRLTGRERRNTLLVLADGLSPRRIDRAGSTLDIYPTLLELLGYAPAGGRAGLGVSLLGTEPTLIETFGVKALNTLIVGNDALSERIWAYGDSAADPRSAPR